MREESVKGGKVIVLNGGKVAAFVRDQKGDGDNLIAESVAQVFETADGDSAEAQAMRYAEQVPAVFESDKERASFKAEKEGFDTDHSKQKAKAAK